MAIKTRFLAGATALALVALSGAAHATDDVRLRLNWMWYGSHAPFALGEDRHYFKDAGINLDIRSGNGSGSAIRLVANGDSDFAYGSCASMISLVAGGAPLISVGVIDATGTEAIIVRPDAGIKKIGDLKGKTILTTANAGVNTFLPIVLKNADLSEFGRPHHQRSGRRAGIELSAGRRRRGRHAWRSRRQAGGDRGEWRRGSGHVPLQ